MVKKIAKRIINSNFLLRKLFNIYLKIFFYFFNYSNNRKKNFAFRKDFDNFIRISNQSSQRFITDWIDRYPCLDDNTQTSSFDRHYTYHTSWAARVLSKIKPIKHIDISSSLVFNGIISAFIPIEFYDYRPADLRLNNLRTHKGDLMNLPFKSNSVKSLSCMHVIEHIGLGRYGDSLDPEGDLKAIKELKRVLQAKGSLLFVVPLGGKAKIMFNAHRIYTLEMIKKYFADLKLEEFAFISEDPNKGGLIINPKQYTLKNEVYGCGCFWFRKR